MKIQRLLIALTVVNLGLLTFLLHAQVRSAQAHSTEADSIPRMVRARGLQIVDRQGRVRAGIQVLPPVTFNGQTYPETVILKLIDQNGRPDVKLSASVQGGVLNLGGAADPTDVVLKAEGTVSSLSLTNQDGRQQLVEP
jgi:hypothetical protein